MKDQVPYFTTKQMLAAFSHRNHEDISVAFFEPKQCFDPKKLYTKNSHEHLRLGLQIAV